MFEADRTDGILCYVSFFLSFFLLQLSAFGRSTNAVGRLEEDHMTQATGQQGSSASGPQGSGASTGAREKEQFGNNSGAIRDAGACFCWFLFCERIAGRGWLWPFRFGHFVLLFSFFSFLFFSSGERREYNPGAS